MEDWCSFSIITFFSWKTALLKTCHSCSNSSLIDNSKRKICNPFKNYLYFFSIEVAKVDSLELPYALRSVLSSGRIAGLNIEAETSSSTTTSEKRLLMFVISVPG